MATQPNNRQAAAPQANDGGATGVVALPSLGDIAAQYGATAMANFPELVALVGAGFALYKHSPQFRATVDKVLRSVAPTRGR